MTWSRAIAIAGSAVVTLACCRIRTVRGHREPSPRPESRLDATARLCQAERHETNRAGLARAKPHQQRSITPTQPQTVGCTPQGNIDLCRRKRFSTSSRRRDLKRLATKSRWRIASIESDDALILPHHANPRGCDFRERQDIRLFVRLPISYQPHKAGR